jgi:eukaryotic-like serine/threonine-protein kinase
MEKQQFEKTIGNYVIIKRIGKGGMGEVYLAYDPICKRHVALKRIRNDLRKNKNIQNRFLKEAKIASQLTHPSIIPIYSIHLDPPPIYYTMPYVEGETLKEILQTTRENESKGLPLHKIGKSIPTLMRIFLNVCEAIAYTHAKGILHRDLKPDNIMVGKYGEVLIFDWGIANNLKKIKQEEEVTTQETNIEDVNLTRPGKLAGTLSHLPPERAFGTPSSVSTDIYALGTILYQILTLSLPFQRANIKTFKKFAHLERLISPIEKAPYRDIPHELSLISVRCLSKNLEKRYASVEALISDIKKYIEGKPQWIKIANLDIHRKTDWQFQENILHAKNIAISKSSDASQWVSYMVSKDAFSSNVKIEADILIGKWGEGIGFLLNIPEDKKRSGLEEGYCIWLSNKKEKPSYLLRSNVAVMEVSTSLKSDSWHKIKIEKVDDNLLCFLDDILILSHASHLPLSGTHVGLIYKDTDFIIKNIKIYSGSHNIMVNCLALPDAFLAKKDYKTALFEYRRIGNSFPGRLEGREALFRAGLTLIEKAKTTKGKKEKQQLFDDAIDEFSNLHKSPGEPLEYLGKSIVFSNMSDFEEEGKCLELTIRKFSKHPLIEFVKEYIIYRLHESSLVNREAAYRISLIALRFISNILKNQDTEKLFLSLNIDIEKPYFIENKNGLNKDTLSILLSYYLVKKHTLFEILESNLEYNFNTKNALFALIDLGFFEEAEDYLEKITNKLQDLDLQLIHLAIKTHYNSIDATAKRFFHLCKNTLQNTHISTLIHIINFAFDNEDLAFLPSIFENLENYNIKKEDQIPIDSLKIKYYLLEKNFGKIKAILKRYPKSYLLQENLPFFFLYGIILHLTKDEKYQQDHFSGLLHSPHPHLSSIACHYLNADTNQQKKQLTKLLFVERRQLFRDLMFYYKCINDDKKYKFYRKELLSLLNQ